MDLSELLVLHTYIVNLVLGELQHHVLIEG
jgi:hypothetical protein